MIKVSFQKIREINDQINSLFKKEKFNHTKFGYACRKIITKSFTKPIQEFNEELETIRIENSLSDPKTNEILMNENGEYKFSKEGLRNFMKEKKSLVEEWDKKEFEVEPYIVADKEVPELDYEQKELFDGILVKKVK